MALEHIENRLLAVHRMQSNLFSSLAGHGFSCKCLVSATGNLL